MTADDALMAEALAQAELGLREGELPIGAVVAVGDEVLARSHWRFDGRRLLAHAELLALDAAEREHDLRGRRGEASLYTTLEPCLLCMGAAMTFMVARVVYALESPSDGAAAVESSWRPELGHPTAGRGPYRVPEVAGGVGREQSLALVREYLAGNPPRPAGRVGPDAPRRVRAMFGRGGRRRRRRLRR